MTTKQLVMTSNVGRDLLQSAAVFKSDRVVVWEYVANSLEYVTPGVPAEVLVTIDEKKKEIVIGDNSRGMNRDDLAVFWTMHAENRDRAAGRIGRGRFGTGKSAAFGIADLLEVSSVKKGKRNTNRLTRSDVKAVSDGSPIPIQDIEVDRSTGEPDGTVITISEINIKRLDRAGVIAYIERHLANYPRDVSVYVDGHRCEFREPEVADQRVYRPSGEERDALGDVTLTLSIARSILPEEMRGVHIFSHGNWHETTLAGAERKPMSEFIFGEIEIPALEDYSGPIEPFDNTRSGTLNPNNPVVEALYRFIGPAVDEIRRELVSRERERKRSEEAKRLAKKADEISAVLSEDFAEVVATLKRVRSAAKGMGIGKRFDAVDYGEDMESWEEGGESLASLVEVGAEGSESPEADTKPPEYSSLPFQRSVEPDDRGDTTGGPASHTDKGTRRSPRGGLSVEYRNLGESEDRGMYVSDSRTIVINLDHPQVAKHSEGDVDNPEFVALTTEIAISEYAVGLTYEQIERYSMPEEAVYDIRDTVNRIARRFAEREATRA